MEESKIKQSIIPEIKKFDDIILELGCRGIVVKINRPSRWGYVMDAVIPSAKVVILKVPDLTRQAEVEMSMFRDFTNRLEGDGYRILIVPKRNMDQEQINAFCDRVSVEPSPVAA